MKKLSNNSKSKRPITASPEKGVRTTLAMRLGPKATTCLWRIDTMEEKRSDPRSARRPRTQTVDGLVGSFEVFPRLTGYAAIESLGKLRGHWCLIIGYDSEVAFETSRDWLLVVTRAFPAFPLSVSYAG